MHEIRYFSFPVKKTLGAIQKECDKIAIENGDYPYMNTVDGNGNKVTLTFPDGMISWLSGFSSSGFSGVSVLLPFMKSSHPNNVMAHTISVSIFFICQKFYLSNNHQR